jgi:hypothetical protein
MVELTLESGEDAYGDDPAPGGGEGVSETPEDPGWNRTSSRQAVWLDPERRNAVIGLAALFLVAAGIVGAAIIFTDPPEPPSVDGVSALDETTTPAEAPEAPDEGGASDEGEGANEGNEGLMEPDDGEEDGGPDEAVEDPPEGERIDFDGVCTVTVGGSEGSAEEAEEGAAGDEVADEPRPWHFDECTSAPVELADSGDQRWIVVLASLPRNEYDEGSARERADELGFEQQVLYSSHYPSLNPDLWVVYDGPFADEDEARTAAAEHGGGAYPRVLADEGGDRY